MRKLGSPVFTKVSKIEAMLVIALSYIVAASINIYPLSFDMAILRPMVLIMVLIFWLMFQPKYTGLFTAFTIGLIADFILDTRLGQQAFAAVVMALIIKVASIYLKQLTTLKTWFLASACLITFQITLWVLQFVMQDIFVWQSAVALFMSIVCWPLLLITLNRYTR